VCKFVSRSHDLFLLTTYGASSNTYKNNNNRIDNYTANLVQSVMVKEFW